MQSVPHRRLCLQTTAVELGPSFSFGQAQSTPVGGFGAHLTSAMPRTPAHRWRPRRPPAATAPAAPSPTATNCQPPWPLNATASSPTTAPPASRGPNGIYPQLMCSDSIRLPQRAVVTPPGPPGSSAHARRAARRTVYSRAPRPRPAPPASARPPAARSPPAGWRPASCRCRRRGRGGGTSPGLGRARGGCRLAARPGAPRARRAGNEGGRGEGGGWRRVRGGGMGGGRGGGGQLGRQL